MGTSESTISGVVSGQLPLAKEKRRKAATIFQKVTNTAEIVGDFLATTASIYVSYFLRSALHIGKPVHYYSFQELNIIACVLGFTVVVLLEREGAYRGGGSLLRIRETERALRVPMKVMLLLYPLIFLLGEQVSRLTLAITFLLLPIFLVIEKHLFFTMIRSLHARGYGGQRVLIYGAGYTGRRVLSTLAHSPQLGLDPVAIVDDNPALEGKELFRLGYKRDWSVPIISGPITSRMLASHQFDHLVIAIPSIPYDELTRIHEIATKSGIQVEFVAPPMDRGHHWTETIDIDGLLLASRIEAKAVWHYTVLKQILDLIGAFTILALLSPFLLLIAFLIRLDSPGPAFFRQERVGKNGRRFTMFKFRSMRTDAPKYGDSPSDSADPRITRLGKILRRTSLDEIPQLFNVLLGDMSLVGPRPEMPYIVEKYDASEMQRLQVTPGITGLWQLSADRAYHIHESLQYDLYYIRNRSFFLDLAVLFHTAFFCMRGV